MTSQKKFVFKGCWNLGFTALFFMGLFPLFVQGTFNFELRGEELDGKVVTLLRLKNQSVSDEESQRLTADFCAHGVTKFAFIVKEGISDRTAKALHDFIISKSATLRNVVIQGEMTTGGAHLVVSAITRAIHLEGLWLQETKMVGDEHCFALCELLTKADKLRVLKLMGGCITTKGAMDLVEGMQRHQGLTDICLARNALDDHILPKLLTLLKQNQTLQTFCVTENKLSRKAQKDLKDLEEQNGLLSKSITTKKEDAFLLRGLVALGLLEVVDCDEHC